MLSRVLPLFFILATIAACHRPPPIPITAAVVPPSTAAPTPATDSAGGLLRTDLARPNAAPNSAAATARPGDSRGPTQEYIETILNLDGVEIKIKVPKGQIDGGADQETFPEDWQQQPKPVDPNAPKEKA